MTDRIEVQRRIAAPAADVFAVLCDPQGHVAIDATGMLQDADGESVTAAGDSFVVHMDREALNDFPLGRYDVTVQIGDYEKDKPDGDGTAVTSFYAWSEIDQHWRDAGIFPIISEGALRATLGILDRTVRRGYSRG
jgi:hypothetical protein